MKQFVLNSVDVVSDIYISYETYTKYFDPVEGEKRRMWSSWRYVSCEHPIEMETLAFKDVAGVFHMFDVMYRENGKKVQVEMDGIRAEASCAPGDSFDLEAGLILAELRWIVKYNERVVDRIAKKM